MELDLSEENLASLSKKICEMNAEVKNLSIGEYEKKLDIAKERNCILRQQLEFSNEKINSLSKKIQNLVSNYAAFEPIIELKNQLSKKATELRIKNETLEKELKEQKLKSDLELETLEAKWNAKMLDGNAEADEILRTKEDQWNETLETERKATLNIEEKLTNIQTEHANVLDTLRRQHHEELEKLRSSLTHFQRALSTKSTANVEVFSSKLQSAKEDFERNLKAKDHTIHQLEQKLTVSEDQVRHLKLLSVVRNCSDATQGNVGANHQPEGTVHRPNSNKEGDKEAVEEREIVNRTPSDDLLNWNEARGAKSLNSSKEKLTKKRKLFAGNNTIY